MEQLTIKEIVNAVDGTILCGNESTVISSVITNSKKVSCGSLFIPIKGVRFDAHEFIRSAFENGACATLTERNEFDSNLGVYIKVKNTREAFQHLAAYYREKFNIPIIAVTGSVGKTSTKEMIAAALFKSTNRSFNAAMSRNLAKKMNNRRLYILKADNEGVTVVK